MLHSKKFIVLTTINKITESIRKLSNIPGYELIVVGDKKTPKLSSQKFTFLSINEQKKLPFEFIKHCPVNSYQRKNIGYLYSISHGAEIIGETDDDNLPMDNWDHCLGLDLKSIHAVLKPKIFNVYSKFTNEKVWPRGFPLNHITKNSRIISRKIKNPKIGVWQGLTNNDPDVDAIYRLTQNKKINFKKGHLVLNSNVFCPFNSQDTFWSNEFFMYMYLPVSVTFRMTDILRGYVAQRCLWEHNAHLGFFGPNMIQLRNKHNLLNDFSLEIPCFTQVETIINILTEIKLGSSPKNNLKKIYAKLYNLKIVEKIELTALNSWIKDIENISKNKYD